MAKAIINLQKESGGAVKISPKDGTGITEVIVPESGELATVDYVDNLKTIATGTATFNSTTNNINLTGIGIGVELGDVIQISGAEDTKNNSEFTVEVITDNNNIIVNQSHANKGSSKNIANRAGDTDVTVKLLCKWYNAPLGLGQGLVDVTSNRTTGVNYPTQPNRAIKVVIRTTQTTTLKYIALNLNGERVEAVETAGSGGPWVLALSETITAGSTYQLFVINDLGKWMEYR